GAEGFPAYRFYLNDSLLLGYHSVHHPTKKYERLKLEKGKTYKIRIEYVQDNAEYAMMRLLWDVPDKNLAQEAVEKPIAGRRNGV
ncbi:PA14 domain, partial [Popillia japonica]